MTHGTSVSDELERVITQASSSTIVLASIGVEARAVLTEERHDPGLTATVLDAHVKRAALALATLSNLVGQLSILARMGAGLVLLVLGLSLNACGVAANQSGTPDAEGGAAGDAGEASVPVEDRACRADEQGYVSAPGFSLPKCTAVVNRSERIGLAWCCPFGWNSDETTEPDGGAE